MKSNKKYLFDVDVAVGIAIVLVVYGHLLFDVKDVSWFVETRRLIYKFHMPLFMFLSGLLMSYSYKPIESTRDYKMFLLKKLKKFVPPYLLFSLIFLLFDYIFYGFGLDELKQKIAAIFLYPAEGSAGFLWYVYVLFEFYVVLPILMFLSKKNILILLVIAAFLQFFNITEVFNLNMFAFYFTFITLGIVANKYLNTYYNLLSKGGLIFLILFLVILFVTYMDYYLLPKVIIGFFSIPAIHFISINIIKSRVGKEFALLGRYSFYIYLMNTLVMGGIFIALTSVFDINKFYFLAPILFLAGNYVPIIIYTKIIKRVEFLNKLIP